ncbi:MAG: ATP-dependent DNA helicase, partial [Rhizobacter sp.]|nr:ATP-dependent DNA helicase [Burkholderiales bacterium]
DVRFGMSPNAREGVAGHSTVVARRGAEYQSEVALKGCHDDLTVSGRADGYNPTLNRLEEIKTFRGDLSRQPSSQRQLHWAQLKVYGSLICDRDELPSITLALVYFNIDTQQEVVFDQTAWRTDLRAYFSDLCSRYSLWAKQEHAHRLRRDAWLMGMTFPHDGFRSGQRELAAAVFRVARSGGSLLAEAPTGIGKSIATLFPMLKAMPVRSLDKIYFLAAKTSGRKLALDAMALCASSTEPVACVAPEHAAGHCTTIRVVELIAKAKACLHPGNACTGATCPLALGFFDRLPLARAEWVAGNLGISGNPGDASAVTVAAHNQQICPYYLAQDLVRWADVVVADYNYYFDSSGSLYTTMVDSDWRVGVLVDEAHNLIERARITYSAELQRSQVELLRQQVPALKTTWARLMRSWRALSASDVDSYRVLDAPPAQFLKALQSSSVEVGAHLVSNADASVQLRDFYLAALHFLRRAETFDDNSVFDLTCGMQRGRKIDAALMLRNVVPAPYVGPRIAAADSAVLFSATLTPVTFYRSMLGIAESAAVLQVPSPFSHQQLTIRIARDISTRFRDRNSSLRAITRLIAQQQSQRPGNYLAFFSSFDYLDLAANDLRECFPEVAQWRQTRDMSETDRAQFVQSFVEDGAGVGFAVLGGAFGEGVDLPGSKLIGAFIATLGLPPTDPVNETLREVVDRKFGKGYEYTYTLPALRKVIQASGRVIRTLNDQGTLHLMDDRFASARVRRLLPPWWSINAVPTDHGNSLQQIDVSTAVPATE